MGQSPQVSRRMFARLLGAGAALAAVPFDLRSGTEPAAVPEVGPLRLSYNENHYGLSPSARAALASLSDSAWMYPDEHEEALRVDLARANGVKAEWILLGNGSSEVLQLAALAALSPSRSVVMANPTFELMAMHAAAVGAKIVKVPLTTDWAHDLPTMVKASPGAGILYICNPNNPTASITPKEVIRQAIVDLSPSTMIIVDEAYAHYASNAFESMIPLVQKHENLIVLRTFSKIYGMAGLRCGFAVAQPSTIARLQKRQAANDMNLAALLAARASLKDDQYIVESRRRNASVRAATTKKLTEMGFRTIPSEANFFMVDLGRDLRPVRAAMRDRGILVGRPFSPMIHYLRVTIGTEPQMRRFLEALGEITGKA